MKEFNKEEYNKMCAEFMGIKYANERRFDKETGWVYSVTSLDMFHTDWNWIMEVVEKINNPTNGIMVSIHSNSCLITDCGTRGKLNLNRSANIVRVIDASSRKDAVVQAIWEFLNWYKTQTP